MTLTYEDFYDIAEYGNANWKGCFTPKEIACNAYNYLVDFEQSKARGGYHISSTIQELLRLLDEDGSTECCFWANTIRNELGLCQTRII